MYIYLIPTILSKLAILQTNKHKTMYLKSLQNKNYYTIYPDI